MSKQLVTPTITPHIRRKVMERDAPALALAHPVLLALAQQPFSQSLSSVRINGWAVVGTERIHELESRRVS